MNVFKSITTSFDKEIISALTEISKELEKYFEERDNTIPILWEGNIAGYQLTQDQLNFAPEDLESINQNTAIYNRLISDKEFEELNDAYMDGPLGNVNEFYSFTDELEEKINNHPMSMFGNSLGYPRSRITTNRLSIFKYRDYYLDKFYSSQDEKMLDAFKEQFSEIYKDKGVSTFDDFFETKKQDQEYSFFINNLSSDKKELADIISKRLFIKASAEKNNPWMPTTEEIIASFKKDFLVPPTVIIESINNNRPNSSFIPVKKNLLNSLLSQEEENIIISAKEFLIHQYIIHCLNSDEEKRFDDLDFDDSRTEKLTIENKNNFLVSEILKLILSQLEFIFAHFDTLIQQFIEKLDKKTVFNTEEDLIRYLVKFYKDIEESEKYEVQFLKGIKLSRSINVSILKCLQNIFKYKLAERESTLSSYLLLPSELDQYKALIFKNPQSSSTQVSFENTRYENLSFSKEKIFWPEDKKDILINAFKELSNPHPKKNTPIVNKVHATKIMKSNFSCFNNKFNPQSVKINGHAYWVYDFVYQLIKIMEDKKIGTLGENRRRMGQFIIQNFKIRKTPITKIKQFEVVIGEIRMCDDEKRVFFATTNI